MLNNAMYVIVELAASLLAPRTYLIEGVGKVEKIA